jgi:hypothetical protein
MRRASTIGLALTGLLGGCGSSATPTGLGPTDANATPADTSAPDSVTETLGKEAPTGGPDLPATSSLFHLIDDMDHTDPKLPKLPAGSSSFFWYRGSGLGNWFVSSPDGQSGDATIGDILPPRGDSKKACHISGSNLNRGVDLWAQLDHPRNWAIDLSAYAGIAFWAHLDSPSGRFIVAFNAQKPDSFVDVGVNKPTLPWAARKVAGAEWERFVLLFDDFGSALAPSSVVSIDFIVGVGGEQFDLWIDDLVLLCRGVCR